MSPPSISSRMHQQLGELVATQAAHDARLDRIEATVDAARREATEERHLMIEKMDALMGRLGRLEPVLEPLPQRVDAAEGKVLGYEKRLQGLEVFRAHVGAVVAVAGSAFTMLAAGIWYLVTSFWADIAAAVRRIFP